MSNKHLKENPQELKVVDVCGVDYGDCWWYEEPAGIYVVAQAANKTISDKFYQGRKWMNSIQVLIPWRSIRAALKRKDRK